MSPFKVSRRDLEQHWRAADDRALASAAEQLEEFTEETVEVVQAELRRRSSLNLATPAAAEDTNLGESDGDAAALEELKEYTPRIPVTITLVALNLVFGVMVISGVPLLDPDAETLFNWGGNYAANTLTGEGWRLVTCTFVHAGAIHLAVNMWVLVTYGPIAERAYGNLGFFVLYMLSGVSASVISMWWNPTVVSVRASGAIFGVTGVLIPFFVRADYPLDLKGKKSQLWSLLSFVAYSLNARMSSETVDNVAHIGGLFAGLLRPTWENCPPPEPS